MIALINPSNKTLKVQYTSGNKVFLKEILPNSIMGMKLLTDSTQLINENSLIHNSVSIYDTVSSTYFNQDASFVTGFAGQVAQSGMTLTTPLLGTPTGYTFVTSAATVAQAVANGIGLNSAQAVAVGNSFRVSYSGSSVTTNTWLGALNATSFSNVGITVINGSDSTVINSGATITLTLSADTASSNIRNFVFADNNKKRSDDIVTFSISLANGLSTLSGLL